MTGNILRAGLAASLAGLTAAPAALADSGAAGGAMVPQAPTIERIDCDGAPSCRAGDLVSVTGDGLAVVEAVIFRGGAGTADDRRATPRKASGHTLTAIVPVGAASGPLQVTGEAGSSAPSVALTIAATNAPVNADASVEEAIPTSTVTPSLPAGKVFLGGPPATFEYATSATPPAGAVVELYRISDGQVVTSWPLAAQASGTGRVQWNGRIGRADAPVGRYAFRLAGAGSVARAASSDDASEFELIDHIFPIRGKHDLGQSAVNGFGGGRGHQGQDMFAACGTPLVAARGGLVTKATFQSRAGNYVVITDDNGQSNAYMHMRKAALVQQGQRVVTGQPIGEVGESGRADGCHLHFELWAAPGWYSGGEPINPLPELQRWDALT